MDTLARATGTIGMLAAELRPEFKSLRCKRLKIAPGRSACPWGCPQTGARPHAVRPNNQRE